MKKKPPKKVIPRRGGARAGAGRPVTKAPNMLRLNPDQGERLRRLAIVHETNFTGVLTRALDAIDYLDDTHFWSETSGTWIPESPE